MTWRILSWSNKLALPNGMPNVPAEESVGSRVLLRLLPEEEHCGKQHQVRSITEMQAHLDENAVRGVRRHSSSSLRW